MIYHLETEALSLIYFGDFRGNQPMSWWKIGSFDILLIPCGNNKRSRPKKPLKLSIKWNRALWYPLF